MATEQTVTDDWSGDADDDFTPAEERAIVAAGLESMRRGLVPPDEARRRIAALLVRIREA